MLMRPMPVRLIGRRKNKTLCPSSGTQSNSKDLYQCFLQSTRRFDNCEPVCAAQYLLFIFGIPRFFLDGKKDGIMSKQPQSISIILRNENNETDGRREMSPKSLQTSLNLLEARRASAIDTPALTLIKAFQCIKLLLQSSMAN